MDSKTIVKIVVAASKTMKAEEYKEFVSKLDCILEQIDIDSDSDK